MLRAEKIARRAKNAGNARDMAAVIAREATDTIESAAKTVLAACGEGDTLRTNLAVLTHFLKRSLRAAQAPLSTHAQRRSQRINLNRLLSRFQT